MSKHADAVGYLRDLENEINMSWFKLICDESIKSPNSQISARDLEVLKALYVDIASYLTPKFITAPPAKQTPATQVTFLEQISDFINFKRLQDTFALKFERQVTLVFGHNGSGKSSVCDALKILANHDTPTRPIHNVRGMGTQKVEFNYKIRGSIDAVKWQERTGFGSEHSKIKYFDSSVAARSIRENIAPGSIVELSPFNMNVFDAAKVNTTKLKESFQQIQSELGSQLTEEIKRIKNLFLSFPTSNLHQLEITTLDKLSQEIAVFEKFTEDQKLSELKKKLSDLGKVSSAEGQKLVASEIRDYTTVIDQIKVALKFFNDFVETNAAKRAQELDSKNKEQHLLNEGFIPMYCFFLSGTNQRFLVSRC